MGLPLLKPTLPFPEASNSPSYYTLNVALRPFWAAQARHKILYGGRASSKSHDAAGLAIFLAANFCVKSFIFWGSSPSIG